MPDAGWRPILTGQLALAATERALEVAGRLRGRNDAEPGLDGSAGKAVLFGQLDRIAPGEGWDRHAHVALTDAVRAIEDTGRNHPGLFVGHTGVAAAGAYLSRGGTRYGGLLATLDEQIAVAAAGLSEVFVETPAHQSFEAFDLIYGLAGTNRYLLARGRPDLAGLVALCDSGPDEPNWFTPPEAIREDTAIAQWYDGGVYNCGLAHGIPGPLATLSIALSHGYVVPRQAEAIARVAEWLTAQRADDEWGANWTSCVTPNGPPEVPAHSAWCYGSPGVAHTLWLAGTAIDDAKLRELAIEAMAAVYRRPWSVRNIGDSPGLCHGVAGLLQITLRFANATGEPLFTEAVNELTEHLLGLYRPELSTGYFSRNGSNGVIREHPGLLDGAAGVALALLAASTPTEPVWDHVLLLS
ncbi:lanthionine synthetase C family protein [Kribbella sp. NBC_01505]|uniref:lanthionine synthetase C family protein n=1 Tax=Kribbella sp. NBC_01505 TaxID=2903580 RepID=UPI003865AA32